MTLHKVPPAAGRAVRLGARGVSAGLRAGTRHLVPVPKIDALPGGRVVDLPDRGRTFVVDVPGPRPDSPTVVLLHALGCTAYLSWAATMSELSGHYRVITFDQRWHGRGIRSPRFRFADCADDVAAVLDALGIDRAIIAGYSMGGAIAQVTWQRHPHRVSGLVLCSTARNFRGKLRERFFFPLMTAAMEPLAGYALARVEGLASTLPDIPRTENPDLRAWGAAEFRSTSAWSLPEVLAELGRFNSAPWIGEIDCPTAVVVTARDHTIPARRQLRLAAAIPDARVWTAPGGHSSLVLGAHSWVPVFTAALADVAERAARSQRLAG